MSQLRPIDAWYLHHDEPNRSCLQFLREYILAQDDHLTEAWKYGMPFFCYDKKMCCYLWVHRKLLQPYIGFVEGASLHDPDLIQEKRARMKILLLNPGKDIPRKQIKGLLRQMLLLYK